MRAEGYCRVVVCVSLLSHISHLERQFVLKTLSRAQREIKVKKVCGIFSEIAPLQRSSSRFTASLYTVGRYTQLGYRFKKRAKDYLEYESM